MFAKNIEEKLEAWKSKHLVRERCAEKLKDLVDFSSNDYLSLNGHKKINLALQAAIDRYGFGSGASALVSGYQASHADLEAEFADWVGMERAILFGSGYLANLGVLTSLADRHNRILSDRFVHASLLEAIQLSRAKHQRYEHLNLNDLGSKITNFKPDYIITESVFGMEGVIAPLKEISALAQKNSVALIVDDAHGFGILGAQGKGAVELISPANISCLINPLGKSFNAMGGLVSGSKAVIELILQFAKTYRYATALPPLIAAGAQAALQVIKTESWRRENLIELSEFFVCEAKHRDLPLISSDLTPIKSLIISEHENLLTIQAALLKAGYKVAAIRPPSVPEHSARLKICLNALHTKSDLKSLLDLIVKHKK